MGVDASKEKRRPRMVLQGRRFGFKREKEVDWVSVKRVGV